MAEPNPLLPPPGPQDGLKRERGKPLFWHICWVDWSWKIATVAYLAFVVRALYWAIGKNFKLSAVEDGPERVAIFFLGLLLSVAPTFYWWWLTSRFEKWVDAQSQTLAKEQIDFEKSYFKSNADSAKAFWAAIVATFVAFLINK